MNDAIPQGNEWNEIINAFSDPQRLHAAMVHLPIMIAALGLLLVLGVIITGGKSAGLRWTTVFVFLIGTLAALWTVETGEQAAHALDHAGRLPVAIETDAGDVDRDTRLNDPGTLLQYHHDLAEFLWIGLGAAALLVMLASIRVTWWKTLVLLLALIVSAANVVWVGVINHYGGKMVYLHGIGVPSPYPDGLEHDHDDDHVETKIEDDHDEDDNDSDADDLKDKDGAKDDSKLRDEAKQPKEPTGPSKLFNGDSESD